MYPEFKFLPGLLRSISMCSYVCIWWCVCIYIRFLPPKVTKCNVVGLGQRYYRDSPLEQTILPQMIAVAFQEANIASGPPDVRPRPTLEFGLGALGLQGSTYRYLPIATFGGARVPPGAPHSPAGPWGLWGCRGGARGPWVGSRNCPGRCLDWGCTKACAPRPLPTFLCSGAGVLAVPGPGCTAHLAGGGSRRGAVRVR